MARTSYGSITITETTDIKTFVRYSENSDGRNYVATPTSTTKYIGVYVGPDGTEANPPSYNNSGWKWSKYQGNGIGSVETKFINWATNIESNKPTTSAAWQTAPPAYDASKPYYYVWTRITYSDASPTDNIYLDAGVSEAIVKSAQALSVAANVVEDAQGAIAIARAQEQHFWFNAADIGSGVNLIESGAYITDTAIDTFKSGKSGGYLLARSDKVEMGKASAKYVVLDATSLKFYTPGTTYKGIEVGTSGITIYRGWDATEQENLKGIEITPLGIDIYGSDQNNPDVTVTSNGINIGKGSIVGADNTVSNYIPSSGFLYLSTKNYGTYLNIADSGNRTDWRLVVGNKFGVTKDGNIYISGATVSGKIVALTGQIGGSYVGDSWGWTLSTGQLYTGTIGTDNSLHMRSFNLSSDVSINGESRVDWRFTVGSKFGVTKNGEIFATDANLSGIIKANEGSIGGANGWTISSQEIKSTNYDITDSGSIYLSTKDLTTAKTINGQSRTDWRFTIGDKFGVTKDGYLYADGLNITNIDTSSITVGPVIYYGVCSTAQSTQIKEVTIDRFQLVQGATVVITFVNGNSNSAPSLKINDGNAIAIKAYDGTSLSSYEYSFTQSNVSRTFTYNGTYWLLQDSGAGDARSSASSAAYTAYNYITKIDNAGIFISPYDQSPTTSSPGNSVRINGEGMEIYNNGISVAKYGSDVRIGKSTSSDAGNVYIDDDSIDIRKGSTVLSTFTANGASLGVNSAFTTIQLCGGVGKISAANLTQMQMQQGMAILTNPDSNNGSYLQFDALAKDGSTSVFSSTVQLRNDKVSGTNQYKAYINGSLENYNTDDSLFFTVSPLGINMDFEDASKNQAQLRISTPETSLFLGIGSGGGNHGIYSKTLGSWIIYGSESGYAFTQLSFAPHTNATSTSNGQYLGWSTHRWRVVYAANGTVQTSDRKHKNIIGDIDFAKDLIMRLKPVEYQWKDSDHRRTHMGFIAQDSAEVAKFLNKDLSFYEAQYLDGSDYRGEETDDENLMWSMKYDELIAPLIKVVQEQQAEIDELKQRIEALERR